MNQVKPATPLPWRVVNSATVTKKDRFGRQTNQFSRFINGANGQGSIAKMYVGHLTEDTEYLVHACNAYPELVAALHGAIAALEFNGLKADQYAAHSERRALLAKLGEAQ